ncbi:MAG: ribonuclease HII [Candidatus Omnitrophica bacterium]|nr:ribonuclease HII [Candidatus Omnitrophota bacterium]
MLYYERKLKKKGFDFVIGVDEAGRGPLAGPVVAAAVALKTFSFKNRIDDSKKLTALSRQNAFFEIAEKSLFGIGIVSEAMIDRINILEATRVAMHRAIASLTEKSEFAQVKNAHVIVDGDIKLGIDFPCVSIIKGDAKSKSIACASILAKVTRDQIMLIYDKVFPVYGFSKHKGYPTKEHRDILKKHGPSAIHRKTFYGV